MLRHLVFKNQLGNYRIALGILSFVVAVHKRSLILFYQGFLFRTSSLTSSLCKKKTKQNKTFFKVETGLPKDSQDFQ